MSHEEKGCGLLLYQIPATHPNEDSYIFLPDPAEYLPTALRVHSVRLSIRPSFPAATMAALSKAFFNSFPGEEALADKKQRKLSRSTVNFV